jgi:TonB family protein
MNTLLELAWRHRWGLIGTIFLHIGFLIYSHNQVVTVYVPLELSDEVMMLKTVEEEDPSPRLPLEQVLGPDGKVTNVAVNQADKYTGQEGRYDSRFDKSKVDEDIYNELKALEKQTFNDLSQQRGTNSPNDPNAIEKQEKTTSKTDPRQQTDDVNPSGNNGSKQAKPSRATASFDLEGRNKEKLPVPSYTCIGSGTVVVKIQVNRSGKVVGTSVLKSATNTTDECMIENALNYAGRAKFTASSTAAEPQTGTITYNYIAQ